MIAHGAAEGKGLILPQLREHGAEELDAAAVLHQPQAIGPHQEQLARLVPGPQVVDRVGFGVDDMHRGPSQTEPPHIVHGADQRIEIGAVLGPGFGVNLATAGQALGRLDRLIDGS